MNKSDNIQKKKEDTENKSVFGDSREQYIKSLEMAVQLLQREIENLRKQLQVADQSSQSTNYVQSEIIDFHTCSKSHDVLIRLHKHLANSYKLIESNIFFFSSDNALYSVAETDTSSTLKDSIQHFEEEGIIDWTLENPNPSIFPDMDQDRDKEPTYFIILPLHLRDNTIGVFVGRTSRASNSFESHELKLLSNIAEQAAVSLDNIRSSSEINKMNEKLAILNDQMLHSSQLASIGELASSISIEIDSPLKIIGANLNLLDTGLGDPTTRIEIIKKEISHIASINTRLSDLGKSSSEGTFTKIDLNELIDEVIFISSTQLQRDGISVEKHFDSNDISIDGNQSQLEQIILNIFMSARDAMPEGGKISVSTHIKSSNKIIINISDNGTGISAEDMKNIFEPYYLTTSNSKKMGLGLYMSKNILKQHKGNIDIVSEHGKGTSIKISLPYEKK